MRLRRPPRPAPHPDLAQPDPPRVYRIRAHMFRIHPRMRTVSIYCTRCQESLPVEYPWADPAAVTEECRRHELAAHAVRKLTLGQFRSGAKILIPDPGWLRARLAGELDPDTDTGEPPVAEYPCAYEWLADDDEPGKDRRDITVTVRDPADLAEWMGPERARKELAAA